MTTVVPTSEEDPVLSVVRFTAEMSWAEAGPEVAEQQVSSLCLEAQECVVSGRWLDLASLMITSADLILNKASDKGCFIFSMFVYLSLSDFGLYFKSPDLFCYFWAYISLLYHNKLTYIS